MIRVHARSWCVVIISIVIALFPRAVSIVYPRYANRHRLELHIVRDTIVADGHTRTGRDLHGNRHAFVRIHRHSKLNGLRVGLLEVV